MWKVFRLLLERLRLSRPKRVFSVRADEVRTVLSAARIYAVGFVVMAIGYGWERSAHMEALSRARPVLAVVLGPNGLPVETFVPDDMTDQRWMRTAEAYAAVHVVRVRQVTDPIDVALAGMEEGRYFVKDGAAVMYDRWAGSQPYHELAAARRRRDVNLGDVMPTPAPGQDPSARRTRIVVQWTERTYSGGRLESVSQPLLGWVDVELVGLVQPEVQRRNPMGVFVVDYALGQPTS